MDLNIQNSIGSIFIFLPEPTSHYIEKGYDVKEWAIKINNKDVVTVKKKKYLSIKDRIYNTIDEYNEIFSNDIISDAKRIAHDANSSKSIPSSFALSCLYLASELHSYPFHEGSILALTKSFRDEKFPKRNNDVIIGRKLFPNIRRKAIEIRNDLGEEKIKRLRCLHEITN